MIVKLKLMRHFYDMFLIRATTFLYLLNPSVPTNLIVLIGASVTFVAANVAVLVVE